MANKRGGVKALVAGPLRKELFFLRLPLVNHWNQLDEEERTFEEQKTEFYEHSCIDFNVVNFFVNSISRHFMSIYVYFRNFLNCSCNFLFCIMARISRNCYTSKLSVQEFFLLKIFNISPKIAIIKFCFVKNTYVKKYHNDIFDQPYNGHSFISEISGYRFDLVHKMQGQNVRLEYTMEKSLLSNDCT